MKITGRSSEQSCYVPDSPASDSPRMGNRFEGNTNNTLRAMEIETRKLKRLYHSLGGDLLCVRSEREKLLSQMARLRHAMASSQMVVMNP